MHAGEFRTGKGPNAAPCSFGRDPDRAVPGCPWDQATLPPWYDQAIYPCGSQQLTNLGGLEAIVFPNKINLPVKVGVQHLNRRLGDSLYYTLPRQIRTKPKFHLLSVQNTELIRIKKDTINVLL